MECTVRVASASSIGTGFFVAPGQLITCAHVVAEASRKGEAVTVEVIDSPYPANVKFVCPSPPTPPAQILDPYPWPDLAWLEIDLRQHPCVQLDDQEPSLAYPGTEGWAYGFTDRFEQRIYRSSPVGFKIEGPASSGDGVRWMLKSGQASPGLSGAPLLNLQSNKVFGVVTRTRDASSDLGAWAVHVSEALRVTPELAELLEMNSVFHATNNAWDTALANVERATTIRPSVVWVSGGDARAANNAMNSAVENLKKIWPPNEIEVEQVRFATQAGIEIEKIDGLMSGITAAIVIVDTDSVTAPCLELARAAARNRVPVIVLSGMDLDLITKSQFQQLESDHFHSFEYESFGGGDPINSIVAYLNKKAVAMVRKKRYGTIPVNPMQGR
ncbi:S1 family peptidase [Streptomyces sp. CA-249302]|uniref:S1 family peptidase n=1 Tax=Streptomyces sp. CA-249302 TaxID=3240058 RepID=UPI003D94FA79